MYFFSARIDESFTQYMFVFLFKLLNPEMSFCLQQTYKSGTLRSGGGEALKDVQKLQTGFSFLFVILVGLLGMLVGYLLGGQTYILIQGNGRNFQIQSKSTTSSLLNVYEYQELVSGKPCTVGFWDRLFCIYGTEVGGGFFSDTCASRCQHASRTRWV